MFTRPFRMRSIWQTTSSNTLFVLIFSGPLVSFICTMVQTVGRDKNYRVKQINNSFLSLFHISFILLFV